MENFKNNLPEVAFLAELARVVAVGAGIGDAIVLLSLALLIGFKSYLARSKEEEFAEMQKKIDLVAAQVQTLQLEKVARRQAIESQQATTATPGPFKRNF